MMNDARLTNQLPKLVLMPAIAGAWGILALLASANGYTADIARFSAPLYGLVIATTIAIPVALSLKWKALGKEMDRISLRALTLFQVPRVLGGVAFLVVGWGGALPPVFALLVGFGDIVAGLAAAQALRGSSRAAALQHAHMTGLADFAIGLTTGMTLGLMGDSRLVTIAELPLSQIVLWWVGMLTTAHVAVLRRIKAGERL